MGAYQTATPLPHQNAIRPDMSNSRKRPAFDQLQPVTSKSTRLLAETRPSADVRLHRRLKDHKNFLGGQAVDFFRHDPAKEALPDLPIYNDDFLKAERACLKMPQDYLVAVKADKDPQLAAGLRPKLKEVLENYQSAPECVAVVGKIGQGKSRLIDALLGIDRIAISGGSGVASTRVPVVYSPRPAHSQTPYEAKLVVSCRKTCRDSVRLHLANIMTSLGRERGSSPRVDEQGSDSLTVLKNLFKDRPEFASDDDMFAFLGYEFVGSRSPSQAKQEKAFEDCIKWAEEQRQKIVARSNAGIYTTNVTELWNEIAPFGNDQTTMFDPELGFNPSSLVERIEIFGDFRIRYSLGDCPGLEDINKDRETKANRYLQDCKVVLVVEDIMRAGDSSFLANFLEDRHRRRPDQRIIVVLSKGDANLNLNASDRYNTSFDEQDIADLDWLAKRKEEVRTKKNSYSPIQYEQRDACVREITFIDLEQRELYARERGRRIGAMLKSRYAHLGDKLTVISVCAEDYMKSIEGYCPFTDSPLPLSVESTQIPTLVRELADIADDRVKNDLIRLYGRTLPELFSFVELACSTTSTTVHTGPKFDFHTYETAFEKQLVAALDAFERNEIRPLQAAIQGSMQSWKDEARSCFADWNKLHGNTIRCFLNKQGNHKTKAEPGPSWNRRLLGPAQKTIDPLYKQLLAAVNPAMQSLTYHMDGDVVDFLKELRSAVEDLDSDAFEANLEDKKPQLNAMFEFVGKELSKVLRFMRGRLTEDGNGDFFPAAMRKHYSAASKAKAMGKMKAKEVQLQSLEVRVCGTKSAYEVIHVKFNECWASLKKSCLETGKKAIATNMEQIKASYKQLGTLEQQDDTVMRMRANLERMVGESRDQCKGPIRTFLLECGLDPNLKSMNR